MGKSESGPDMQDCSLYLAEMEQEQDCSCTVLLEVVGFAVGYGWRIHVLSVEKGMIQSDAGWSVATSVTWPNRANKTFEGALFRALAENDAQISRAHFQRTLDVK